ncbi:MAG: carbamoyltransferase HypF [Anaerolineae bacterium]|nr:carbamoyltransferase HypF [Anaerolineae bacterium]
MTNREKIGQRIFISGIVQGVGFRPFVYTQAVKNNLTGWVRNTSSGVQIEVTGLPHQVENFVEAFYKSPPPLARIDTIELLPCPPSDHENFEIIASQPAPGEFLPISPDMSICNDCLRELFDSNDRRYRYPFINCTNCGPRFTIIKDIPYDRPNTTMSTFAMCQTCQAEYNNPLDRRFHAQPIACPQCGPHIAFKVNHQIVASKEDALQQARKWITDGKIIAVKGLGGYHLVCDASNPDAVSELRRRKKRVGKPFALMSFDLDTISRHVNLNSEAVNLLTSPQHPIVLLERQPQSTVVQDVAPGQKTLGFMLPYTPLHYLLLEPQDGFPDALVMTSGNLSEEPIAYEDDDAQKRLSSLADGFLLHNRPIHTRVDDSVARVIQKKVYPIRRARGYAPDPVRLPTSVAQILAVGAELKNAFCLTRQNYGFVSHYIGDLENYETLTAFEKGIRHFETLFRITPKVIACDLHPDYLSTQYAIERSTQEALPLFRIQHHHAHLAACLADNGWNQDTNVIGLCFDGTGLGTDGNIWGGEVLVGNYSGFTRRFHLANVPMPGGSLCINKPSRMALAYLHTFGYEWNPDLAPVKHTSIEEQKAVHTQLHSGLNAPLTSSMGRLFDAVSSLLDICHTATYEGQAAIELENLADPLEKKGYPLEVEGNTINPFPLLQALITDWQRSVSAATISARFHNSLVQLCLTVCQIISSEMQCNTVVLSGGVWQNQFLLERTLKALQSEGFQVLIHKQVPPNDACISLGQAMIAAFNYQIS